MKWKMRFFNEYKASYYKVIENYIQNELHEVNFSKDSKIRLSTLDYEHLKFIELVNDSILPQFRSLSLHIHTESDKIVNKFIKNSFPKVLKEFSLEGLIQNNQNRDINQMIDISFYLNSLLSSLKYVTEKLIIKYWVLHSDQISMIINLSRHIYHVAFERCVIVGDEYNFDKEMNSDIQMLSFEGSEFRTEKDGMNSSEIIQAIQLAIASSPNLCYSLEVKGLS